jgi:hypothetical protein
MSRSDGYDHLEAFIEQDQLDWMGDGVAGQLVTIMMSDELDQLEPAVCDLWPAQARALAFRLLSLAEHADRLTRRQESDQ